MLYNFISYLPNVDFDMETYTGACPSWDGRFESFETYKVLAQAYIQTFKDESRTTVGGRLLAQLKDYAFELAQDYDVSKLGSKDGGEQLIKWLEAQVQKEPAYLLLDRFKDYMFRDRVSPDDDITKFYTRRSAWRFRH